MQSPGASTVAPDRQQAPPADNRAASLGKAAPAGTLPSGLDCCVLAVSPRGSRAGTRSPGVVGRLGSGNDRSWISRRLAPRCWTRSGSKLPGPGREPLVGALQGWWGRSADG